MADPSGPDPLDYVATLAAENDLTLELRHPGRQLWRLQAVSTPDAVRTYRHFHQRRHHVEIDGALTLEALRQAAIDLTMQIASRTRRRRHGSPRPAPQRLKYPQTQGETDGPQRRFAAVLSIRHHQRQRTSYALTA